MKKKIGILLLTALAAFTANASISIRFASDPSTCYDHTGVSPLPVNQTVFIYASTDSNVNFNSSVPLTTTYGDDVYIATVGSGTLQGAGAYSTKPYTNSANTYVGYYTYIVIVEQPYVAGTTPTSISAGTYYGYQTVTYGPISNSDAPGTPQAFTSAQPISTTYQNVPEPTTFALLGLGLGIVAIRKRLRQ